MRVRSWLLTPVPATFRHPIRRPISDADLVQAWAGVPTDQIRPLGGHGSEPIRINKLRQRVLDMRRDHV